MEDFLQRKLEVGDSVVFIPPLSSKMRLGRIISFTAKMVKVKFARSSVYDEEAFRYPSQLVKVDGPDLTMYLLKK